MAEPFIGEIRLFAYDFDPRYWAECAGQLLSIQYNTALYAILQTTYGGDGETTFALPDLRGRAPMHPGAGPGLTSRVHGESGGAETVGLLASQLPAHRHAFRTSTESATLRGGGDRVLGATADRLYGPPADLVEAAEETLESLAGGAQPHNNMQPYLSVRFCIALQGIFPPR